MPSSNKASEELLDWPSSSEDLIKPLPNSKALKIETRNDNRPRTASILSATFVGEEGGSGRISTRTMNQMAAMEAHPSTYLQAIWIFFSTLILPSMIFSGIFRLIPLQQPGDLRGYNVNWGWSVFYLPISLSFIAFFPSFLVSSVMGKMSSENRNVIWRIASVTMSVGLSLALYASYVLILSPFKKPFPVYATPIWMGPIVSLLSIYISRLIRLSSDWKLPESKKYPTPKSPASAGSGDNPIPSYSNLEYTANRIKDAVRSMGTVYIISMIASGIILLWFDFEVVMRKENPAATWLFNFTCLTFVLIPGKKTSEKIMADVLAASRLTKGNQPKFEESNSYNPIVVAGSQIWWNLMEISLIFVFAQDHVQITILPVYCCLDFFNVIVAIRNSIKDFKATSVVPNVGSTRWGANDIQPATINEQEVTPSTSINSQPLVSVLDPGKYRSASESPRNSNSPDIQKKVRSRSEAPRKQTGQLNASILFYKTSPLSTSKIDRDQESEKFYINSNNSSYVFQSQNSLYASPEATPSTATTAVNKTSPISPKPPFIAGIIPVARLRMQALMLKSFISNIIKFSAVINLYTIYSFAVRPNFFYLKVIQWNFAYIIALLYALFCVILINLSSSVEFDLVSTLCSTVLRNRGAWISLLLLSTGWTFMWVIAHGGT